ncbi:lipase family protein [Nocardioides jishulii]|uniref:Triacylglycerol lipase n=1 Tax=Nocardioides jishulii TaxID=2575440 RepID=A0A4U2YIT1_9ACTN|nr:lipase family protein [Nocardioides jishulii]QCX28125.1 triacylglycerol lipase [Nocardioides jishulii]TKI60790.1 triacylglycerol lipase [Nocardioides jishulii]
MIRSTRVAAAVGVVLLSLLSPTTPASAAEGDFYTPPAELPAANGALVKAEPMKLGISFPLGGRETRLPGTATRIMYRTTTEGGTAAAVSGVYIEPSKRWSGTGDRPLVSFSVGTQGVADACAPSKTLERFVNVENDKFMVGYEVPSIYGFLNDGVAVVVTDYVGLGTPGVHTYMNRIDQGNAVLDAARAALALPGTSLTKRSGIGLYGYSQGGGAAGAAAELAPTYAPELNLKGAYVGGPPANLFEVMKSVDGSLLTGAIPWSINALHAYRPELTPYLDKLVNAEGRAAIEKSKEQCVADAILAFGLQKTSRWTRSGNLAAADVAKEPTLLKAVDDQRIGRLKPTIPVQVLTGTKDDIVAHGQAKQLALDWCAKGANVTYRPVIQLASSGGLMLTHLGPLLTQQGSARDWVVDRLNGRPASSNCSTARLLP